MVYLSRNGFLSAESLSAILIDNWRAYGVTVDALDKSV
jgi:hypothetical protein